MFVEVITPEEKLYEGEVSSATFPGSQGSFQILNNHAPIVSTLKSGQIKLVSEKGNVELNVSGGVVEVNSNKVIVLAEK